MTPLGKPLVFYLKYMAEMDRLWDAPEDGEESDLTELDDAEHVREMARTVGAVASEQAADFLELCGREIKAHFTRIGATLSSERKRIHVLRDWYWWVHVGVPAAPHVAWFSCAVFIHAPSDDVHTSLAQDTYGIVEPYLWFQGGRKGADAVRNILGGWPSSRASSTVTLASIPIKAQPPESFEVDRDPLVAEVMKTIARIGVEETESIVNFVASLKKPDED
jgi:hypothetical protein